jgi:hypothetical protein
MKRKCLAVGIIFLFIGITVAPSINLSIVKASNDNDLVEVTSEACGIKGFGNTTVKLTRQQYQNLEQYLVDFRARLNQTTTREEAIPIFKEAVVELNKYGLLPKGMNVKQAQSLVTGLYQNKNMLKLEEKLHYKSILGKDNNSNYFCLIAGIASHVLSYGFPARSLIYFNIIIEKLLAFLQSPKLVQFLILIDSKIQSSFSSFMWNGLLLAILYQFIPLKIFSCLSFGIGDGASHPNHPSNGWIFSIGLAGIKNWIPSFIGNISTMKVYVPFVADNTYFIGATGFTGISILLPSNDNDYYFFLIGTALHVSLSPTS